MSDGGPQAVAERRKGEVLAIVADIAEVECGEISRTASLESLGIDSLGGLRLVAAIEQKFKIVIDEAEIPRVRTVADVFALVERLGGAPA